MVSKLWVGVGLMLSLACGVDGFAWAAVPSNPSDVYVQGTQLIVRRRNADGALGPPTPYVIKGVTWNPATRAPKTGPNPLDPYGTNPAIPDIVDYGFFFDWPGRIPQGHEIFGYWSSRQFAQWYLTDLPLMEQMHVNTVRVYNEPADAATTTAILDECYRRGIMVVFTVAASKKDFDTGRYLTFVNRYKNHPAILTWLLGNEWNLNLYYGYPNVASAAAATQQAAQAIHAADPSHPVSSSLSDISFDAVAAAPAVDLWGLNVYRGISFGDLFTRWKAVSSKPFYLSEFGIDAFHSVSYTLVPLKTGGQGANNVTGQEQQGIQADVDVGLWKELIAQLSALDARAPCIGGLVHTFNDNLYKVGSSGLWELVDYDGPDNVGGTADDDTSYDEYNSQGYYLPGAAPDNVLNEEYFGIVDADRRPKVAFSKLQQCFTALSLKISKVTLTSGKMVINGPQISTKVEFSNSDMQVVTNLALQGWVVQGATRRAAGGALVNCGTTLGTVPAGASCATSIAMSADDRTAFGTGKFVAGPARLLIELRNPTGAVFTSYMVPVTLAVPQSPWQSNAYGTLYTNVAWHYAMGYHFTPQVNGQVTALGGYFNGTKLIKLFNKATGVLLRSATVTSANTWSYAHITPMNVTAGTTYTVAVYLAGSGASYRAYLAPALPRTFGSIRIDGSTYIGTSTNATARPTNTSTSTMYGQADIEFVPTQ